MISNINKTSNPRIIRRRHLDDVYYIKIFKVFNLRYTFDVNNAKGVITRKRRIHFIVNIYVFFILLV